MKSNIYQKIKQSPTNKLAFIDVDNTLTANPWDTNEKDLLDVKLTNQAIELLQKKGYCCILNTSRTEEMCMSSTQYGLSQQNFNFKRPPPQIGITPDGKQSYVKPENFYPNKLLNLPIIISSSGAKISVLQKEGGYKEDTNFYPDSFPDPYTWRKEIIIWLSKINLFVPFSYSPIDSETLFFEHKTDVFPPDYRVQLSFTSQNDMMLLSKHIKKMDGLYLTNDSEPDKHIFTAYITPKNGKIDAVDHIIHNLQKSETEIEIFIIGDSLPDLEVGIQTNPVSKMHITFLLVGGSKLTPYLLDKEKNIFAGINLTSIKKKLSPSKQTGFYTFTDLKTKHKRNIIIADEAFPQTVGPKSIVEFIKKNRYN